MKTFAIGLIIGLFFGLPFNTFATEKPVLGDSIVIKFGKNSHILIYLDSPEDAEALSDVDLDEILETTNLLVDSARKSEDGQLTVSNSYGQFEVASKPLIETGFGIYRNPDDGVTFKTFGNKDRVTLRAIRSGRKATRFHLNLYLGINSFIENGSVPVSTDYELRPLGSRYVELHFQYRTKLGKESPLSVGYGLNFAWQNFMFQGNRGIRQVGDQVEFVRYDVDEMQKSKLAATFLNLPLMLYFKKDGFHLAAGGYGGYKISSHSKLKFRNEGRNDKVKNRENFGMEALRYGIRGEIGYRNLKLFANYDLNQVFTAQSGLPELNALSFGIKLL